MHEFVIMVEGELKTYSNFDDIPEIFDHVIKFIPEIPDGPHSDEQHEALDQWNDRLAALIAKENAKHGN